MNSLHNIIKKSNKYLILGSHRFLFSVFALRKRRYFGMIIARERSCAGMMQSSHGAAQASEFAAPKIRLEMEESL